MSSIGCGHLVAIFNMTFKVCIATAQMGVAVVWDYTYRQYAKQMLCSTLLIQGCELNEGPVSTKWTSKITWAVHAPSTEGHSSNVIVRPRWEDCKNNVNNFAVVGDIITQPVPTDCPRKCAFRFSVIELRKTTQTKNPCIIKGLPLFCLHTRICYCFQQHGQSYDCMFGHVHVGNSTP